MPSIVQRVRKLSDRLIRNRRSLLRDLWLVSQHIRTVPYIVLPIGADPEMRGEFSPGSYASFSDFLTVVWQMLVPLERQSCSNGTEVVTPPALMEQVAEDGSRWFFLNGIATSPPLARLNASEMARVFSRPVHLIHTPTYGVVWDFWDAVTARTLRKDGHLSRPAYQAIRKALRSCERVVLVGHSQGTIIISYVVRKLLRDPEMRALMHRLEVYCIAGVADSFHVDYLLSAEHGRPVPYVEHFVNGYDFFARIGVLAYRHRTSGSVFVLPERRGHMFNDHYLGGIERGEYCNGKSRLYKYVHGREPRNEDFVVPKATL